MVCAHATCVFVYMCVCMCVCMRACVHVCVRVCVHVCGVCVHDIVCVSDVPEARKRGAAPRFNSAPRVAHALHFVLH